MLIRTFLTWSYRPLDIVSRHFGALVSRTTRSWRPRWQFRRSYLSASEFEHCGPLAFEVSFKRAAAADQRREALGAAATGVHPDSDFRLAQQRVLARGKTHITHEHEFAADPTDAASNLRDAGHRRSGDAHERVC